MIYAGGNLEAFATPLRPEGIDAKAAYIIGSGIAGLAAACFLVRDAQMDGQQVHILEKERMPGGACDGYRFDGAGYVCRGLHHVDENSECLWDLLRSIPSLETEGSSVLDEYYRAHRKSPSYTLCRATMKRGQDARTDRKFGITDRANSQILQLFFMTDEDLQDLKVTDVFDEQILGSNFWLYFRSMYHFENWHSALELKHYLQRYLGSIEGMPDASCLRTIRLNQYESLIQPMIRYLQDHHVQFHYGVRVTNVEFEYDVDRREAVRIDTVRDGLDESFDLTSDDLVFISIGGCAENSTMGDQKHSAVYNPVVRPGSGFDMWRRIAVQDDEVFGHPEKFFHDPQKSTLCTATIQTLDEKILPFLKRICKRDPFGGDPVSGGEITVRDSGWQISWIAPRQPLFRGQPEDQVVVWLYGLTPDQPGNRVRKPMKDCTGQEICEEWLYHLGVPERELKELAEKSANTVPVIMPYATSSLVPRDLDDRPAVVPEHAVNFAFLGQFADCGVDAAMSLEHSVRTGMIAAYTLAHVERAIPESAAGRYDLRTLLTAMVKLRDDRKLTSMEMSLPEKIAMREALKKIRDTDVEKVLEAYHLI